jgi:hypothetical protein
MSLLKSLSPKKCPVCKREFNLTVIDNKIVSNDFHKQTRSIDGLSYICKECKKEIDRIDRINRSEQIRTYSKSPEFVYSQLKHQAKKREMPFELTFEYYLENLANKPCKYCHSINTKHWVDRYKNDHKIGYTIENSVPCCEHCNKSKMDKDPIAWINHCKEVAKHN